MSARDECREPHGGVQPDPRLLRNAEAARLAEPQIRRIRKELARWLARARSEAGLSRREVADRMGYAKPERGMSRIARWERGEEAVWGDRIAALARALGVPVASVAAFSAQELTALRAAAEAAKRRAAANAAACQAELRSLARCARELSEPGPVRDRLFALPDVVIPSAGWSIALRGGGHLSLHFLLRAWRQGLLTAPCDCCDDRLLLTWVAGSPSSGAHRMRGICRRTGSLRTFTFRNTLRASELLSRTARLAGQQGGPPRCDLTLAEVLAQAGLEVPAVRIRNSEGLLRATFDPTTGVITPVRTQGAADTRAPAEAGLALRVSCRRGPARVGGSVVIGGLAPLTFGAKLGASLELVGTGGRAWRLHPGYLEAPDRQVAAWFEAPVPPVVASWLAGEVGGEAR